MLPTNNIVDNMAELYRLFPKTSENVSDMLQPTNSYNSIYSQSPIHSTFANRSSSSADSTSPESYSDLYTQFTRPTTELYNIRSSETPIQQPYNNQLNTRRRPIVGRKILGNSENLKLLQVNTTTEQDVSWFNAWGEELFVTPPNTFEHKNQLRNYELFPTEKPSVSTTISSLSPITSNISPFSVSSGLSSYSPNLMSSFTPRYPAPPRFTGFSSPSCFSASSSKIDEIGSSKMCTFCRKNGETPVVYMTHSVKEKIGAQSIVTCPILRSHVCSTCGATGDDAHTITYCPILRCSNNGKRLQSTTITLKNTRIKSNGRRRF